MSSNLERPTVRVNMKAADRVFSGHPWIFASDVIHVGDSQPGDAVRVVDPRGRSLGTAHYSSTSMIALRILSLHAETLDEAFFVKRLASALAMRKRLVTGSEAYRLVHAEGDLLPGLIVDRYGAWLVVQLLDQGMDKAADNVVNALTQVINPAGIVARNDVPARTKENLSQETKVLKGEIPSRVHFQMNGLRWSADLMGGQKTGIYLDQRENYVAVRRYARGRVLDCFTGTGGFALHLASTCEMVEAVDSSAAALTSAKENAEANSINNVQFHAANILEYLPGLVSARKRYDTVIVDPPAFTKSRAGREGAARGYKEINLRALRLLEAGGTLVSCCCSHHTSEADLLEIIASAALDCGKQLRVLERRTQSVDHPILLTVPETHYLKCLIFEVL